MEKDTKKQIKIGLFVTVAGGLILALILYPLGYALPILKWIWGIIASCLAYLRSPSSMPRWLVAILAIGCIPTFFRVFKRFLPTPVNPLAYTQDTFFGLVWRWSYPLSPTSDQTWCFCPKCDTRLVYNEDHLALTGSFQFFCETCNQGVAEIPGNDVGVILNRVIRQIERNVRTDIWKERINEK